MVRFYRNLNIFAEIQWLWQSFLVRIWNNENALKPKPFQSVFSIPSLFFSSFLSISYLRLYVVVVLCIRIRDSVWDCLLTGSLVVVQVWSNEWTQCKFQECICTSVFFMDLIIFFFNPKILDLLDFCWKNLTKISIPMMLCDEKVALV